MTHPIRPLRRDRRGNLYNRRDAPTRRGVVNDI